VKAKDASSRGTGRSRAAAWVAAAVGLVVLLVGSASAAPVSSTVLAVVHSAPYTGTLDDTFVGEPTGCGISANFPVLPFFNLTMGQALESVKASAHSCGAANSTVYLQSAAGFTSTSFTASNGLHHLTSNWVLNFSANLSAIRGTGSQVARAMFAVYLEFELFDRTSGFTFYQSNYPELFGSGTSSVTYPEVRETVFLNATLVKGHSYEYEVEVLVAVEVFVTNGNSRASASVNLGSGGRNALLTSVTRT
jgi:hypothetical protein